MKEYKYSFSTFQKGRFKTKVKNFVSKTRIEFNRLFEIELQKEPIIKIVYSKKLLDKIWGRKKVNWLIGFAGNSKIHLLHPYVIKTESSHQNHDMKDFWLLVRHELFHLYHQQCLSNEQHHPAWLMEGAACYFAGQVKIKPSNQQLLEIFNPNRLTINNAIGYHWVKTLVDKFGKETLIRFIKSFKGFKQSDNLFTTNFYKIFDIKFSKESLEQLLD